MSERPANDDLNSTAASLSALMDGECHVTQSTAVCERWQADLDTRRTWHAYQLIGDVLRSDELCGTGTDATFVHRLRQRLADEPVVLAPSTFVQQTPQQTPQQSPALASKALKVRRPPMRRWAAPMGAAAGVALVASAVWVTRPEAPFTASGAQVAGTPTSLSAAALPVNNRAPASSEADVAQFERYLSAHKQFQPTAPLNPTAGYLRSAVYEANGR